jgi:serine/threonine-protein kinase RsbT
MSRTISKVRARVQVRDESDAVVARRLARELAAEQGLSETRTEALATAVTEIARNIVVHAGSGEVAFCTIEDAHRRGVIVTACDIGPGIPYLERAMEDGFSTMGSLGFGLPGARRLVDEFDIESKVGTGTIVTLTKWNSTLGEPL